jgi:hypothetical protein
LIVNKRVVYLTKPVNEVKTIVLFSFTLLIIPALSAQTGNKSKLIILNLEEAFSQQQDIPLSTFVDKISYVPLETKPDIVLGRTARFEVTDDFILVKNVGLGQATQILLFDRSTGKFIREIGKPGRGPGEYYGISFLPYNLETKEIYASGPSGEIMVYDVSGKYIEELKKPSWTDPKAPNEFSSRKTVGAESLFDGKTFAGYVINFNGWEDRKLLLFTREGIIKIFPNYMTWTRKDWKRWSSPPGGYDKFYQWDRKLYFIETFCDTLYQVTGEVLLPRYYFNFGKFKAEYSKQEEIVTAALIPNYFFLTDIDENNDYIFIQLSFKRESFTGIVEKKSNKITFIKKSTYGVSGLRDDINGLMDVVPKDFTQKNEMVYLIQPFELFKWFEANPEKAALAKNKLPWLKSIDESSNPVIVIAKCKE